MSPLFHSLNIFTLATWLSATGFGTVGITVNGISDGPREKPRDAYDKLETIELAETFFLGDPAEPPPAELSNPGESNDVETSLQEEEILTTPPEMPELADLMPLPEVPNLPESEKRIEPAVAITPPLRRAAATITKPPTRSHTPARKIGGSLQGSTDRVNNSGRSSGTGVTDANRLSGGRMPAPSYPSEARSKGQSGTVVVEFIVGENGRVISAYAKRPSPWPLLNDRAVSAVLRWKFPAGGVAKFTRPIVFKLN